MGEKGFDVIVVAAILAVLAMILSGIAWSENSRRQCVQSDAMKGRQSAEVVLLCK